MNTRNDKNNLTAAVLLFDALFYLLKHTQNEKYCNNYLIY